MPDAVVEFGGKTDDLAAAASGAKGIIQSVDDVVRKLAGDGTVLGAVLVGAFSIVAIEAFANSLGKVAEDVQRVSSLLGTDIPTTSFLGGIGALTNTPLKDIQSALEAINTAASTATADKFSMEAQAFKQLKINADALTDTPVDTWFEKIAVAIARFNPDMDRAALLSTIGGESLKNLMPVLAQGAEGWRQLADTVRQSGAIMTTGQTEAFAAVRSEWSRFQLFSQGTANSIYAYLAPAMVSVVHGLTDMTESFNKSLKNGGAWSYILSGLAAGVRSIATAVVSVNAALEGFTLALKTAFDGGVAPSKEKAALIKKEFEAIAAKWMETVKKIWDTSPTTKLTVNKGGEDADSLDSGLRGKARAQQEALEQQIIAARGAFEQEKVIADARTRLGQQTAATGTRSVIEAEATRYAAEIETLEKEKVLWNQGSFEYERVQRRIAQATQQHQTEVLRMNAQLAMDYKQQWDEVFGALQSSFNSQLRGLLAGTTTWRSAFKSILGDMLIFFIQMVEKMVFNWIAGKLAMAAVDQAEVGKSVATATAVREATLPIKIAGFMSDITAAAALAFANTYAALAAFPPAAAAAAAGSEAVVLSQLAGIPKFEMGTDYVPYTGLAMVHEGEKITPASENKRGSDGSPIHIHAWDGQSVERWLKGGGAEMLARATGKAMTKNPSLRPRF